MWDRAWSGSCRKSLRRGHRPEVEGLDGRVLLAASLATIAPVTVPATLGYQVSLNGSGTTDAQTFTVTSSNPNIKATVAQGKFLTFNITHTAAAGNASDVTFSGPITYQLFDDLTPLTASRIESFVSSGFYNGKIYHRIAGGFPGASDFIFQGGSLSGTGSGNSGQPGTPFPDEFVQQIAFTGSNQLAMANSGPVTNDTQFFHTTGAPAFLNFHHNIFAQLVADPNNILSQFSKVALSGTTPVSPITINNASLSTTSPNGVVHVDATAARAGETATISVTATSSVDNSTAPQTFTVTTTADGQVERPFIPDLSKTYPVGTGTSAVTSQPIPFYQQTIGLNQVDTFQVPDVVPTPGDPVTYTVQGDVNSSGAFTPVQNATATINQSNGIVTLTPKAGYSGTIDLLVGVRDNTNRANAATINDPGNYQYQRFRVTVNASATPVPIVPIAGTVTQQVLVNKATTIQLTDVANPTTPAPNTKYNLVTQPSVGTISNFNAATGSFTYNAPANTGTASFQYNISSTSPAGNTITSNTATATLNISTTLTPTPTAGAVTQAVTSGIPTTVQLLGNTNNPGNPSATLTYALTTQPTIGTISNFNPATGSLTYTAPANNLGADTFQYTVSTIDSNGNPLTSAPGTVTLNVALPAGVNTGAVRLIGNVLVITPLPSTTRTPNLVYITEATDPVDSTKNVIQVIVNGTTDLIQPTVASLNRIVVFGSKKSDDIQIDPSVDAGLLVTLDGGHGGKNAVQAGAGPTVLHGWFGSNTLIGGAGANQMYGRAGHVHFRPSSATDLIFAGNPHSTNRRGGKPQPPGGTFYKDKNGHLVAIPTPTASGKATKAATKSTHHPKPSHTTTPKKK